MILNDTHKVAFVHIPKCAGTTVRSALADLDEHKSEFFEKGVATHSGLGRLDHHHIPLSVLRTHFVETFTKLTEYHCFALVRDPYARFPSSLHERFVQRDRRPLSERDKTEISREVDSIIEHLSNVPKSTPVTNPELIHFSRQVDYIFDDDRQIVRNLFSVTEVDRFFRDISVLVGRPVEQREPKNTRDVYASARLQNLQKFVTCPIEAVLPRTVWKPLYRPIKGVFRTMGIIRRDQTDLSVLPNYEHIKAFIGEFYAADIALYSRVCAAHAGSKHDDPFAASKAGTP